jgi:ABC-type antimicrobial peptide transport system permease subunit
LKITEGFTVGFAAIRANKMRSLLTMLGIVIGIASVLAMIAIGDGAKLIVLQDAQKLAVPIRSRCIGAAISVKEIVGCGIGVTNILSMKMC